MRQKAADKRFLEMDAAQQAYNMFEMALEDDLSHKANWLHEMETQERDLISRRYREVWQRRRRIVPRINARPLRMASVRLALQQLEKNKRAFDTLVSGMRSLYILCAGNKAAIAELNEYGGIRTICESLKYLFTCGRPPDVFKDEAPMIELPGSLGSGSMDSSSSSPPRPPPQRAKYRRDTFYTDEAGASGPATNNASSGSDGDAAGGSLVESDEGGGVVELSSSLEEVTEGDAAKVEEINSEHGSGDEGDEREPGKQGGEGGEGTNRVDMDLHHLVGPDHEPDPRIGNGGENEAAVLIAAEQGMALMACLAEGGDLARSQLATFGAFDLMSEGAFSCKCQTDSVRNNLALNSIGW